MRLTSDEVNNAIVVYATPRDYAVVEDALRQLDIAPSQVMIEAAITEVTLTDALRFGVQGLYANHNVSAGPHREHHIGPPDPGVSRLLGLLCRQDDQRGGERLGEPHDGHVVSAPKLMVLNNQTASIEVGAEVPILTGSATSVLTSDAPWSTRWTTATQASS